MQSYKIAGKIVIQSDHHLRIRMDKSQTTVAIIGLGRMGSGMAKSIQEAGYPIVVWNRSIEKTEPFARKGAKVAATPGEAASAADIVLTSLLDDASVFERMTAEDGILAGLGKSGIHLSTTTISPQASGQFAKLHEEHGSHYVATNVLGRPDSAASGALAALVAGDKDVIARVRPVLETFTNMIVEVGENPANAARMKLTVNFFLSGLLEVMSETFVFAEKHDLDTNTVQDLMIKQVFPNPAVTEYARRIRTGYFDDAGATLITGLKDLTLILSEASDVRAPLPIADLVRDNILKGLARGEDALDWCVSTRANRIAAGID
jgi:3-hydroxyisobutyrate dehydrogenase-like beta-hydroxyacid dehydrogenase